MNINRSKTNFVSSTALDAARILDLPVGALISAFVGVSAASLQNDAKSGVLVAATVLAVAIFMFYFHGFARCFGTSMRSELLLKCLISLGAATFSIVTVSAVSGKPWIAFGIISAGWLSGVVLMYMNFSDEEVRSLDQPEASGDTK